MKKYLLAIIFLVMTVPAFQLLSAQVVNNQSNTITVKEPEQYSNALNLNPLSFLTGSISGSYEHVFGINHGLFVEGSYSFGKGRGYTAGYRYHYGNERDNIGIYSSYWGLFVTAAKRTVKVNDSNKKIDYDLDMELLNIGINWGTRYNLGGPFNFAWRVGYGFPVNTDFSWSPAGYKDSKSFEKLTKVVSGIDLEISFGILF
jgi:hypothetical protein